MKTILVPTDFSKTAQNAAEYAIGFAKQMFVDNIILLNCWQPIVLTSSMSGMGISEIESIKEISEVKLLAEKNRLESLTPLHINVKIQSILGSLNDAVEAVCMEESISYIVMGITGGGAIQEKLVGSNTISISQNTPIPLIVVPTNCVFKVITKVMFLCDFVEMDKALPEKQLVDFLEAIQPQIDVVNFDPNFKRENDENAFEKFYLHELIRKFSPKYKYSLRNDIEDALNEFVDENESQLVINISKKHGWLYTIFHPSFTNKLAFHTTVPLMVLHN